jgi:hypothetical protein
VNGKGGGPKDLYKDKKGNVYEKPKGGRGPGEPIGINLNNLSVKIGVGAATGAVFLKFLDYLTSRFTPIFMTPIMLYPMDPNQYKTQVY